MSATAAETTHTVTIGSVRREHVGEDCERDELSAYVSVPVTVDGVAHRVGTMVGVRPANQGSARASGCGASGPYLATWQEERSDLEGLTDAQREAVTAALYEARARLWSEVEGLRGETAETAGPTAHEMSCM